jgi:SnoaL-like domain
MNGPSPHTSTHAPTHPHTAGADRHKSRVAQITRLADRAELTELIFRVGLCLDEHRFEDLAGLFVEDGAVITPNGAARGHAALVEHATASNAQFDRMQHVTTNVLIDFEDDHDNGPGPGPGPESDTPTPSPTRNLDASTDTDMDMDTDMSIDMDADTEPSATNHTRHARIRANIIATFCLGTDPHPVAVRGGVSLGKAVRTPTAGASPNSRPAQHGPPPSHASQALADPPRRR